MGYPEYPSWKQPKRKLRRYKCRICDRTFRDWYLPEEKRICPRCAPLDEEDIRDGLKALEEKEDNLDWQTFKRELNLQEVENGD